MRTAFKAALASFGMTKVDLAATGTEALMRVKGGNYDIVISDYNLGEGRDGQQVLEEMRHRNLISLSTAFLMVTAESVYERVVAAAELAPDDYLIKPFNGEILRNRLEGILYKKEAFADIHRHFGQGRLEEALAGCEVLMKTHPKYAVDVMRFKGEVLLTLGNFEAAEELYKQIIRMRAVPWSRLGLAKALHFQRKEAMSEDVLHGVLDQHPQMVAGYDLLADVQMAQNKARDAQGTLSRAVRVSAKSGRRQRRLGEVAYQNGDLKTAEVAFKDAIEKGKNSMFFQVDDIASLARVHLEQGQVKAAGEVLANHRKTLQESDEGKLINAIMSGRVSAATGDEKQALECAQQAVKLRSLVGSVGSPELALEMVQACLDAGMDAEAATLLEEVARNAHDSGPLLEKARQIYKTAGKESTVSAILSGATEVVARLSREGALLLQRGEAQKGAETLMKASEAAPRNPRVLMNAVWALLRVAETEGGTRGVLFDAKRLLAAAADLAPNHPRLIELRTMLRDAEARLAMSQVVHS